MIATGTGMIVLMAKSKPVYELDRERSKQRARDLQAYLNTRVAKTRRQSMVCKTYDQCKASAKKSSFHEAQGHSVGRCYDLSTTTGRPFRVLVVPMEAGGGATFFSVPERTNEIRKSGFLPIEKRFPRDEARNPHMKGVTLALRLALGLPYADRHGKPFTEPEEEEVSFTDGSTDHLFECFAMANLLLCSAVAKKGGQAGRGTPVMRNNCARHLKKTIGILQPTLVISQGWGLVGTLCDSLGVTREIPLDLDKCYLAECELNGNRFVWVALYHPTRFWSTINQPYFKETVVPAITVARERALKLAPTA